MTSIAVEQEVKTFPASDYISSVFLETPIDSRFSKFQYDILNPVNNLPKHYDESTQGTINFIAQKKPAPMVYLLHEALLQVQVVILDKDGNLPLPSDHVSYFSLVITKLYVVVIVVKTAT